MYIKLGFADIDITPLRQTLGVRATELISKAVARHAGGSIRLSRTGKVLKSGSVGVISQKRVKTLLQSGSGEFIAGGSRFDQQTGGTHGGLVFSRTPTRFFHESTGQFADVDLSGCYAAIIGNINLYVGQPVLYEPGSRKMLLNEAVKFVMENAAGTDAWIIKVTGNIESLPNALIPSTLEALTHDNYTSRKARKNAKSRQQAFKAEPLNKFRVEDNNAALFTDRIEAGIVAWPTWLMIQAMPDCVRQEYENLEVETVLFYATGLVAEDGPGYDSLVAKLSNPHAPWSSTIDMDKLRKIDITQLDAGFASIRFPLGNLAIKFSQFRHEARQQHGKGSGAELAYKQHLNAFYGVLCSKFLYTNNVVAANVITATGRALAFAMQMSLNGFKVITDGCIYRRDQVPATTFAE